MPEQYTVIVYSNFKNTVDAISKTLSGSPFAVAGITDSFINTRTLVSQYAPEFLIIHLRRFVHQTTTAAGKLFS